MESLEDVQSNWMEVCGVLAVHVELARKWWFYIHSCYQSDGRQYHTLNHICSMLSHLRRVKEKVQYYEEVSLAIFFHELVLYSLV